uniref:ENT domain-containing protein n=1 Tax=Leersia perrieri TaxID=77586 RepID=A0A0D9WW61_9ORYZ
MVKLKGTRLPFREDNLNFAAEGTHAAKKNVVRVHQPVGMRNGRWVLGDITEVLDHNSWRLGKITKVLKNDYFVIRVTGCIQMREFHISCLRFPHAYHGKQSAIIDKVREQSGKQTQHVDHKLHRSKMVMQQDRLSNEVSDHITKRHKGIDLCPSSARNVKKKLELSRLPTDDYSITGASKKRRATAHEVCQQTKKPRPLKVSAKNDIYRDHLCRPFSDRYNDLCKNITKREPGSNFLPLSQIPLQVREENECSVASCSVNFSEHSMNTEMQSVGLGNCFPDDAMSSCASMHRKESDNVHGCDFRMDVHELEVQAYQSTVRAFYASGPLTWEQESLLTNLRLFLNITIEEHLLQLRHLLSS